MKFADDLTLGVPGTESGDTSRTEFDNVQAWSEKTKNAPEYEKTVRNGCSWGHVCDSA